MVVATKMKTVSVTQDGLVQIAISKPVLLGVSMDIVTTSLGSASVIQDSLVIIFLINNCLFCNPVQQSLFTKATLRKSLLVIIGRGHWLFFYYGCIKCI